MIALPLWQPWATLLVIGAKRVETRSWAPRDGYVGQRMAIYATVGGPGVREVRQLVEHSGHFAEALGDRELPRGFIVGTVRLVRASEMTEESIARLAVEQPAERAFGSYEPGRWAWVMADPVAFDEPIHARPPAQHRGPFEWTAP